ncbi:MAG: S8 family serine peptidase [Sandaracinaceae bacterium]|nr:S8 family serine peptidase [Sandaracinaceae bacterium]
MRRLLVVLAAGLTVAIVMSPRAAAQDVATMFAIRRSPRGTAEVLVRLARAGDASALVALGNEGVSVRSLDGRPLVWRDYAVARVDARGLVALAASPAVLGVRALPPRGRPPLDRSRALLGLDAARAPRTARDGLTGRGVLVADLDSLVDPFHPDLFHADAGWYDWIDLDGDGVLTPGVDAIDLDRDGAASEDERASVLRASPVDLASGTEADVRSASFDPQVDWLFLDEDADGERSFGPGFGEDAPALGEPLFVPDDVDGDGVLEPSERLVRLGAPKIRAVYVHVDYPGVRFVDRVYERGASLTETPSDVTSGLYGYADALHATGVLSIVLGGVPLPSRRWVGVAPEAEAIVAMELAEGEGGRVVWALSREPDVVLHEYVTWTLDALDGSDAVAELIDASSLVRVAHLCPVGNIGGAGKHVQVELAAGASEDLAFSIEPGARQVQLSLHARGEGELAAELVDPAGRAFALGPGQVRRDLPGGGRVIATGATSARGTRMVHAYLLGLPSGGGWRARVTASSGGLVVHGMLADEAGFAPSSAWQSPSDRSTVAIPATADACSAIGAIPAHLPTEGPWFPGDGEEQFQLRSYSGRGPRIDGASRPDLVAPDNPWAAASHGDAIPSAPEVLVLPHGAYQVFGGTSGAGPHVAGVAMLLAQAGIRGAEAQSRLRSSALADPIAGSLPNDDYGHGRLSAASALGLDGEGAPPRVELRCEPSVVLPGQQSVLRIVVSDPDGSAGLEVRWDDGYDGAWDTDYGPPADRAVRFDAEGTRRWKVRVRDPSGRVAEASARLEVRAARADAGAAGGSVVPGGGGCTCRASGSSVRRLALLPLGLLVVSVRRRQR